MVSAEIRKHRMTNDKKPTASPQDSRLRRCVNRNLYFFVAAVIFSTMAWSCCYVAPGAPASSDARLWLLALIHLGPIQAIYEGSCPDCVELAIAAVLFLGMLSYQIRPWKLFKVLSVLSLGIWYLIGFLTPAMHI